MHKLLSANSTITQLNERLGSERSSVMISGLAISHYGRLASIIVGTDSWSTDARGAIHCANSIKSEERSHAQGEPLMPTSVSINRCYLNLSHPPIYHMSRRDQREISDRKNHS